LKYFQIKTHTTTTTTTMTNRAALFQKSTRKNEEFERFLCDGQEAAILDATRSKYIPLSYFVGGCASHHRSRSSTRNARGLADKMPYESFRLINVQQRGNHAHSLVLFKSRAITTNPEQIAIFECNGQYTQSEIRVIHTEPTDETGTAYDVTESYFSPISPKVCLNYGNDTYNPGYCGMFGIIAMVFFRRFRPERTASEESSSSSSSSSSSWVKKWTQLLKSSDDESSSSSSSSVWVKKWTQLLKYMHQDIPDEPESHGCMGISLAAKVQEIIAAHPSTQTAHQQAEKEIYALLKQALKTMKHKS
jgi:hypothetical protein